MKRDLLFVLRIISAQTPCVRREENRFTLLRIMRYAAFWQCAQVPVISTTESFGANPEARAALDRLCATDAAGISPTEPQRSQIRNATNEAASWSCAQAR